MFDRAEAVLSFGLIFKIIKLVEDFKYFKYYSMKIDNRTRVLLKRNGPISNRSASVYKGVTWTGQKAPPVKICAYYSGFVTRICRRIYLNIYKDILYRAFEKLKIQYYTLVKRRFKNNITIYYPLSVKIAATTPRLPPNINVKT